MTVANVTSAPTIKPVNTANGNPGRNSKRLFDGGFGGGFRGGGGVLTIYLNCLPNAQSQCGVLP
jgi:hypothetical protein